MARSRIPIPLGHRFGALVVQGEGCLAPHAGHSADRQLVVRCDCGRTVEVRLRNLRTGNTLSCGCHCHRHPAKLCA